MHSESKNGQYIICFSQRTLVYTLLANDTSVRFALTENYTFIHGTQLCSMPKGGESSVIALHNETSYCSWYEQCLTETAKVDKLGIIQAALMVH